jgi:FkbM family methyltransferase
MKLLPDEGSVLDIGANIGIMSVLLGRTRPALSVYSFEPIPENFAVLNKVCSAYSLLNVQCFQIALGNKKGQLRMIMPTHGSARMQGLSHVVDEENEVGEVYEVEATTLDAFFETSNDRITGIKIDVENFEFYVLDGARGIIKRDRPIIYAELWDNENRTNCIELLAQHSYKAYLFNGQKLELFTKQLGHNFFFIPNERIDLLAS